MLRTREDREFALACLKLATIIDAAPEDTVARADAYYAFVSGAVQITGRVTSDDLKATAERVSDHILSRSTPERSGKPDAREA
jgi:hypothetical protein